MTLNEFIALEAKVREEHPHLKEWEIQYLLEKILEAGDEKEKDD